MPKLAKSLSHLTDTTSVPRAGQGGVRGEALGTKYLSPPAPPPPTPAPLCTTTTLCLMAGDDVVTGYHRVIMNPLPGLEPSHATGLVREVADAITSGVPFVRLEVRCYPGAHLRQALEQCRTRCASARVPCTLVIPPNTLTDFAWLGLSAPRWAVVEATE